MTEIASWLTWGRPPVTLQGLEFERFEFSPLTQN